MSVNTKESNSDLKPVKVHKIEPIASQIAKRQKNEPSEFEKDLDQLSKDIENDKSKLDLPLELISLCIFTNFSIEIHPDDQNWARPSLKDFDPATTTISKFLFYFIIIKIQSIANILI